jgi:hypothetical protein
MKKIVMTMVALLTMTAAVAQDNNSENRQRREFKKPTPEEMTTRMTESLKLDDKQQKKVLELNKEYENVLGGPGMGRGFGRGQRGPRPDGQTGASQNNNNQQRPERPQMTEEQRAKMQQMMEKRQEYDKKLKEILTDDQYKTYQEQNQRRGGRGGRGGFGGPRGQRGPRPDMN